MDLGPTGPDRSARRASRTALSASLRFRRTDLDDDCLLDDPELDAILLATPVFTHYDLAYRCLQAGKHCFVEKPLAPSSEQAAELIEFSRECGLQLMCGHTFLYSPPVRAVRELISSGELGSLYFVSSSRVNLGTASARRQRDLGPRSP